MSSKPSKPPTLEDYLTSEEFRARFVAEKAKMKRHYCTLFAFWRSCAFSRCHRERACRGDQHKCLKLCIGRISRSDQFDARARLLQATPRNMAAPERAARSIMPGAFDDPAERFRPDNIPRGWTRANARRKRRAAKR